MLPQKQENDIASRKLGQCETQISDHEQQIQNLVEMVAKASTKTVANAYHAQIEKTQAALDRLQVQRERFRQEISANLDGRELEIAEVIASMTDSKQSGRAL